MQRNVFWRFCGRNHQIGGRHMHQFQAHALECQRQQRARRFLVKVVRQGGQRLFILQRLALGHDELAQSCKCIFERL